MSNATGNSLKILRKQVAYSQSIVAQKLGKSQSYISRVENGKSTLSEKQLDNYLTALQSNKKAYDALVKTYSFLEKAAVYQPPIEKKRTIARQRKSKKKLIEIVKAYFKDRAVKSVYIFGSVARNEHTSKSDLDIMVAFKDDYKATLFDLIAFKQDLAQLTDYEVDIVQEGTAYPHIQASFEKDKIAVYG